MKACLTSHYPRDHYVLTDKLIGSFSRTEADIRPFFESQLDTCGVDYFDFYLMHTQREDTYGHFKECRTKEPAFVLKTESKIRHLVIFFHDRAEMLERILMDYPLSSRSYRISSTMWTVTILLPKAASAMTFA